MEQITAKYSGICSECGGPIRPGDTCLWNKGLKRIQHAAREKCGEYSSLLQIGGGSGYGCHGWSVGEVVPTPKHLRDKTDAEYLVVTDASRRYVREDGLSFGVGDESGYIHTAYVRPATAEEAAPYIAEVARRECLAKYRQELDGIFDRIFKHGDRPDGDNRPEGDQLYDSQNLYGGGKWFVVGPEWIWAVLNNGGDGDCWAWNNVVTGGAGAIGSRIPYEAELETRIRQLASDLAPCAACA